MFGLRPDGDPDAMRAYATTLRSAAGQWASAGSGAAAAVDRMTFAGPAGDQARARAGVLRTRSQAGAQTLRLLADDIDRRAADVAQAQASWQRLLDRAKDAAGGR